MLIIKENNPTSWRRWPPPAGVYPCRCNGEGPLPLTVVLPVVHEHILPREGLQQPREGVTPMSSEKNQNVQDVFLNYIRKNKTPVTIFLINGVKLQGIVTWFDNFSVLLRRDAHSQLVYKHAISTVMPAQPIQLFDPAKEAADAWDPR